MTRFRRIGARSPRVTVVTTATGSYLAAARVLAAGLAAHQPSWRVLTLCVDATPGERPTIGANVEVVVPEDLVPVREAGRRILAQPPEDPGAICGALLPTLALRAIADGAEVVLLVDADQQVLAPIGDLGQAARTGVLLSPHAMVPLAGRPGSWPEERFLRAGVFNGGLVGVGAAAGTAFLEWWSERVAFDCVVDASRGLHHEQGWLALVPALFPHVVLRDPGVNVTAHALGTADLDGTAGAPRWAGRPVRLLHFTGFSPAEPEIVCRHLPAHEAAAGERPVLRALLAQYATLLREAGWSPERPASRWDAFADGTPVDAASRAAFRRGLLDGEVPPVLDPFSADGQFMTWLRAPDAHGVSRYLHGLWAARADLQARFPGGPAADAAAFLAWAASPGTVGPPFAPTVAGAARGLQA